MPESAYQFEGNESIYRNPEGMRGNDVRKRMI
jgi:hypothetical protein